MNAKFNPQQYRGKGTVYIAIPKMPGISSIWDWVESKKKYVRRTLGIQYYAYRRVNGAQRSKCFETIREAKEWRDTTCLFVDEQPEKQMTFSELKMAFFTHARGRLMVTTCETYESSAKHLAFFDRFPVVEITPKVLDAWLRAVKQPDYLKLQHSNRVTYHAELSVLRQILTYYMEYENDFYMMPFKKRHHQDAIIDPIRYMQSLDRNRKRFIPGRDFDSFLGELARNAQVEPEMLIFLVIAEFQLGGGTRIGEACAIDFKDILDWDTGAVSITKSVQWSRKKGRATQISPLTKTGESRVVYLTGRAMNALRRWKEACGRSKGLVFSFDGFQPIGYRAVQYRYDKAFKALDMQWKSTHILRHSYSTDFLEKTGGDKSALQAQLGHSTSRQTDHYAKITETTQIRGVRAYEEGLRGTNVVTLKPKPSENKNPEVLGELLGETKQES